MSQPTAQQLRAIDATGGVLLTAGAGTGKTATLVERCARLVTTQGVAVDRLLVVTFTNAAASEMKQRLRDALGRIAAERPEEERLRRQLLLLESAHISTLHAFCLELVRAHFAELGLDPGVSVLETSVTGPLARNIALDIVRRSVGTEIESQALAERYCSGSGEMLAALILQTHRFFFAQPQAEMLLDQEIARFGRADAGDWRERRRTLTAAWVRASAPVLRERVGLACSTLRGSPLYKGTSKTAEAMARIVAMLGALEQRFGAFGPEGDDATARDLVRQAAALNSREIWVRNTGAAREPIEEFLEAATLLNAWQASEAGDPLDADWALVRGPMRRLLEMTREFGAAFGAAKQAVGGLDFADLEQFALRLLLDAEGRATRVAEEWRERLDHVFVDECQDINAAQDALIAALSREGARANLFMVGDVKQSIYRFRLAAPELFRMHATAWGDLEHHQVLPLTENFRSREGILGFVNDLFELLFTHVPGGVGYGLGERLGFALPERRRALSMAPGPGEGPGGDGAEPASRVELHLVRDEGLTEAGGGGEDGGEGWGDLLDIERQAWVAATRLQEMMAGGHEVWDKRETRFRRMAWSDVGLLLRAVRGRTASFLRQFRALGIPLAVEQGDFLETVEALDLTALLRVLDNPRQDIPLFAVLRSPLVGWTLDELAELPPGGRSSGAWDRLELAVVNGGEIGGRVREFLGRLGRWRRLALMTSLTAVLETVLAETRYEAYLYTLPDGVERVANVRRFLDLAQRYDPLQRQGLSRFLRFLDEQQAAGQEIEPLPPRQAAAVQLLSVHKSKGLEFPVVVLVGIGARFQMQELRASVLFSRFWGVAPQVVDLEARRRYDSLALWQAKVEERAAALAEELRLFYVAVTRARDTLLLVGSFKPDGKTWQNRVSQPASLAIAQARSYCEWIGIWLGNRVDWGVGSGDVTFPYGTAEARLRWRTYQGAGGTTGQEPPQSSADVSVVSELETQEAAVESTRSAETAASADVPRTTETGSSPEAGQGASVLDWCYPHAAATRTAAKTSASALRRLQTETDEEAVAPWPMRQVFLPARRAGPGLSAATMGSAHHMFLENVDLDRCGCAADLAGELDRLRSAQVLGEEEAGAIDLDAILAFWTGPVGVEVRRHAGWVRRELAFTAAFAPSELARYADRFEAGAAEEFVVVQGAVDLAVLLPGEIWVVDFKTDRVAESDLAERAREHERQLRLYAAALHRIYGRSVTRCWLHFLTLHQSWEVVDPMRDAAASDLLDPTEAGLARFVGVGNCRGSGPYC
jgi:ATP-dependent helicase/nuclease subunit A